MAVLSQKQFTTKFVKLRVRTLHEHGSHRMCQAKLNCSCFGEGGFEAFEAFEGEGSKGGGEGGAGAEVRKAWKDGGRKASKGEDEGFKGFEGEDEGSFEGFEGRMKGSFEGKGDNWNVPNTQLGGAAPPRPPLLLSSSKPPFFKPNESYPPARHVRTKSGKPHGIRKS